MWGVSLTHPMLLSFLCREFARHILRCLHVYVGSFSYTSQAVFVFRREVSLTHSLLACFYAGSFSYTFRADLSFFLCGEFLLHIPCWLYFYLGRFSYTSHAGLFVTWGVSLTHPVLAVFFCGEFLLHIPCWLYSLSLTHTVQASSFFNLGSFSYTSRAGFIFIWGV